MTAYTDFHYSPTGSGVISGSQVLEQTEQGINGLGQYVQNNISGAIDTANQALTIAQTANTNATTALNTANSFSDAITTANQTANNALTTAQSAQNTANTASSLASTANNNANTALNAANTATSNVATLTGTVNSLGNRMTTAENAISTNAGNITTLQTNLQTTNNNVTAAANAASAAQATATSAQGTATLARNQAYVLRYTGTTITGGGTIAYADIDNTDNIKAGDKIIDATGAIYAIASVDTANQTATVGASPVINLFCDAENLIPAATDAYDLGSSSNQWNKIYSADVVHTSGNETIGGNKKFSLAIELLNGRIYRDAVSLTKGTLPSERTYYGITNDFALDSSDLSHRINQCRCWVETNGSNVMEWNLSAWNTTNLATLRLSVAADGSNKTYVIGANTIPEGINTYDLGSSSYQWNNLYAKNYFYNGTAWGLDKANVWSAVNQYSREIQLAGDRNAYIAPMWEGASSGIAFLNSDATKTFVFGQYTTDANNRKVADVTKGRILIRTGERNGETVVELEPRATNATLGTATAKWKTLNGVNPGALSLPKGYTEEGADKDYINIASVIQTLDGTAYSYTLPDNGWICVRAEQAKQVHVTLYSWYFGQSISHPTGGTLIVSVPFRKNDQITLKVNAVTLQYARFYPMQGNV